MAGIEQAKLVDYLQKLKHEYSTGDSTELTYRSFLKSFIESVVEGSYLSEEKKKVHGIGRPDYTSFFNNVKNGYIETKDIDVDLEQELEGEQIARYVTGAIPNLILTDYLRFILVRTDENGKPTKILEASFVNNLHDKKIHVENEQIQKLENLLSAFFNYSLPTIKSAKELANELAKRTRLLRDLVREQLELDIDEQEKDNTPSDSIYEFYIGFREIVKDAPLEMCVNAFSETITYGLFLARIGTKNKITRDNASSFIPSTIKIIKKIFMNISGDDLPTSISWIVEEIIDILNASDLDKIIADFDFYGKNYRDPFTHFYEDFLQVYDPEKRKQLGVYYTPEPIVSFICRSVNQIIKKDFGRQYGLASSQVTLLDPCTGTGTFLARAFLIALEEARRSMKGAETQLIKSHLLANFSGFEILVSPYVISHLKLTLLLNKENYQLEKNERLQIYLTNTLDDAEAKELGAFMGVLSSEVKTANEIKLMRPIMVVLGNPPYYYQSSNRSEWILELINEYKKDLNEQRHGNLDDDYVKFLRFAQWKIEKNESGVIGFVTNNGFLDNTTFRLMRKSLLSTFNDLYILNLHGDSNKKERAPDGGIDENVFDIRQGVAISLFVKVPESTEHHVYYHDLWGKRLDKSSFLDDNDLSSIKWEEVFPDQQYYSFKPLDLESIAHYQDFFAIDKIFDLSNSGILTKKDDFLVCYEKNDVLQKMKQFTNAKLSDDEIKRSLNIDDIEVDRIKHKFEFKVSDARAIIRKEGIDPQYAVRYFYRPFDIRWIYFSPKLISRPRKPESDLMLRDNLAMCISRFTKVSDFASVLVADGLVDLKYCESSIGCYFFPLYKDKDNDNALLVEPSHKWKGRPPNFTPEFTNFISALYRDTPSPAEIFYYIYAILHSPTYRSKYRDYLKIDFPKIPFVKKHDRFAELSSLGKKLVNLHLMKDIPNIKTVRYSGTGSDNTIRFVKRERNSVWINENKYFDGIPDEIWNFEIGGYQVLNKWLKSRKDVALSYPHIEYFTNLTKVIISTIDLMKEIDQIAKKFV